MRTYLIFGDIEGKLDVLNVECTKCARKGRYHVQRLIEVLSKYFPVCAPKADLPTSLSANRSSSVERGRRCP
jgi:hypothetical protein